MKNLPFIELEYFFHPLIDKVHSMFSVLFIKHQNFLTFEFIFLQFGHSDKETFHNQYYPLIQILKKSADFGQALRDILSLLLLSTQSNKEEIFENILDYLKKCSDLEIRNRFKSSMITYSIRQSSQFT